MVPEIQIVCFGSRLRQLATVCFAPRHYSSRMHRQSSVPLVLTSIVAVLAITAGQDHFLAQGRRGAPPVVPVEGGARGSEATIQINKPMPVPDWALAERELMRLNAEGVSMWAQKYLDANGYLRGAPHFGIEDGPDDAVETIRNWPI